MSEEEHIILKNSINEDVNRGIELSFSGWHLHTPGFCLEHR
jgi:hypothetical protein